MDLIISRYDPESSTSRYDTFTLEPEQGMTVLGALFAVQERFDDSLAFRYSCRGAVCGTCAVLINKVPRLACRTQVLDLMAGKKDEDEDEDPLVPYPGNGPTIPYDPLRAGSHRTPAAPSGHPGPGGRLGCLF